MKYGNERGAIHGIRNNWGNMVLVVCANASCTFSIRYYNVYREGKVKRGSNNTNNIYRISTRNACNWTNHVPHDK